ncbi:MAG: PepSY-like domain-containing protein [Muribaculaceae bacterium]|nr:PepSY-like domain-containing protein [Muribaculaceae bacterium]
MKRLLLIMLVIAGFTVATTARNSYSHDVSQLPAAAQTILKNNFKASVSVIKIDKDFGRISDYEVILTDGTEVTFDRNGNWENIETSNKNSVPKTFIPEAIRKYVATAQPGTRIVGIDKERSGYEIELSNGIDMKFDRQGNFLRYDD